MRQEGTWVIESFRPGKQPFDRLASALVRQRNPELIATKKLRQQASELSINIQLGKVSWQKILTEILDNNANKHLLLVIDQFEELYTFCRNTQEQQQFVDTLLTAISSVSHNLTLVLTLRADFYSYVLNYPLFGEALEKYTPLPLRAMNKEEMLSVIKLPAQKMRVKLEEGLTERILNDVEQEPGNLPLLEFALKRLWEEQRDGTLTHQAYEKIGGVRKALVKHAEEVYCKLSEQKQAQRIFLQLVHLNDETQDTRRIATRGEIDEKNWRLVTYLAGSQARLVVTGRNEKTGEETVEIVHEALIREWERLRIWISENRENLIQKRKIEAVSVEWQKKAKSEDYLLQSKELNNAIAFKEDKSKNLALSSLACELIQKSIIYRRNNRLKLIGFNFSPVVLLSIFLGYIGIGEIRIAQLRNDVEKAKGQRESFTRVIALQELVKLGIPLNNIPLNNTDLKGISLAGANLAGANLAGVNLWRANLKDANLKNANLWGANLTSANLSGANLDHAIIGGKALLSDAHLENANLWSANLEDANLERAHLENANLSSAILRNANLSQANLDGGNLSNANLWRANLNNAHLFEARLFGADFFVANLKGAYLYRAKLENASLFGSNLEEANFTEAHLSGDDLSEANLKGAIFTRANLSEANLKGANFKNTNVEYAYFSCSSDGINMYRECTDLRGAKNLTLKQVKQARNWEEAFYDPKFRAALGLNLDIRKKP